MDSPPTFDKTRLSEGSFRHNSDMTEGNCPRVVREENDTFWKFNEQIMIQRISEYIKQTYSTHYSGKTQPSELIFADASRGKGFIAGNIIKYASRLGRKGSLEDEKKDLMKIVHYAIIALHFLEN